MAELSTKRCRIFRRGALVPKQVIGKHENMF
jgi:hypothetical protein